MYLTNKKWINPKLKKTVISRKKFHKLFDKQKIAAIYDLRINRSKKEIKNDIYKMIDPVLVQNYILIHSKKEIIVLVSEFERTYVSTLTWAKKRGYRKIFILRAGKDSIDTIA